MRSDYILQLLEVGKVREGRRENKCPCDEARTAFTVAKSICAKRIEKKKPTVTYLELDDGAGGLQLLDRLVGLVLLQILDQRLGRGLDELLGRLEVELGQLAHLLDDLDLGRSVKLDQLDGEISLGGGGRGSGSGRATGGGGCACDRRTRTREDTHTMCND